MPVIETTGDAVPGWSRMPKESTRAVEAVREYLKMGASRSIAAVSIKLGKHLSLLERWSTKWGWVGRATAYDDYLAKQEQMEIEKQAIARGEERRRRDGEQSEMLYRLKQKILSKVDKMLDVPLMSINLSDGKTTVKPSRWGLRDAAPLVGIVLKIDKAADREGGEENNLVTEEFVTDDYK
jgi:transposase-like protein